MSVENPTPPSDTLPENVESKQILDLKARIEDARKSENSITITEGGTKREILNPYIILGITTDASLDLIKKKYRTMVTKVHPDSVGDEKYRTEFDILTSAYNALKDSPSRQKIDLAIVQKQAEGKNSGQTGSLDVHVFTDEQKIAEEATVGREWQELSESQLVNTVDYLKKILRFISLQEQKKGKYLSIDFFNRLVIDVYRSFVFSVDRNIDRISEIASGDLAKQSAVLALINNYSEIFDYLDQGLTIFYPTELQLRIENIKSRSIVVVGNLYQKYSEEVLAKIKASIKKADSDDEPFSLNQHFNKLNQVFTPIFNINRQLDEDQISTTKNTFLIKLRDNLSLHFIAFLILVNKNISGIENSRFLYDKVVALPPEVKNIYGFNYLVSAVQDGLEKEYAIAYRKLSSNGKEISNLRNQEEEDYNKGRINRKYLN